MCSATARAQVGVQVQVQWAALQPGHRYRYRCSGRCYGQGTGTCAVGGATARALAHGLTLGVAPFDQEFGHLRVASAGGDVQRREAPLPAGEVDVGGSIG